MSTQDGVTTLKAASPAPASGHSPAYQDYLRSLKRNGLKVKLWQIAILVVFLVVWEAGPRMGWINPMLTSYPSAVFKMSASLIADGSLAHHTWATFRSTVIGFVGGMLIGTAAAIALYLSPFLHRILDPFIVVLNALPKIALVPLFFIWLGDMKSIYAMAIVVSVFVTTLMLYTGFQAIDPDKVRLVRLFGASRWQVLTKVVLPGSVPTMISTLKINVGLSLVGVVVGEFQAAKAGLGYLITYGSQIFQMNLVMTSVVVLAIISTLMFGGIQALEAFIYRRRGLA
jgi:NitT/TauT family transport system permease protein